MYLLGIAFLVFIAMVAVAIVIVGWQNASFTIVFMNISVAASYLIGTGLFRDLMNAFKIASHKVEEYTHNELKKALTAIKTTIVLVIISGFTGLLLGVLPLLTMYDGLKDTKPYFAFVLISILYSLFGVLFLLPIKARLNLLREKQDLRVEP